MGTIYIVSTPIGNLKDITLRALEILRDVDFVVCEDTRHTGLLLAHYKIKKPLLSCHEYNELKRIPKIIQELKLGKDAALVSDAGTPTLSDPGLMLIRECQKEKLKVVSIPGPSAMLAALTSSGLSSDKFIFFGYLPKKQTKRLALFDDLKIRTENMKITVIFFESPHRLLQSLNDLSKIMGDIEIVIARELTKIHEEVKKTLISQFTKRFQEEKPKGEFTILF